jgi:hypothetical protein
MNTDNLTTSATAPTLWDCEVASLRVSAEFRLALRFRDGLVAELDFSRDVLEDHGPMAAPLRDPEFFARVTIEDGALTWPNGYDIDPVTAHLWAERGYIS